MTEQQRTALKELQRLDTRILETREQIQSFDPRFEEVEEPVLVLESELGTLRKRAQEMKLEERRLELSSTRSAIVPFSAWPPTSWQRPSCNIARNGPNRSFATPRAKR